MFKAPDYYIMWMSQKRSYSEMGNEIFGQNVINIFCQKPNERNISRIVNYSVSVNKGKDLLLPLRQILLSATIDME